MTYRIFQYRLPMDGQPDDLNAWLASHRVVSVTQHLASAAGSSLLVFIVETTGEPMPKPSSGPKIDYKEKFNESDFTLYSKLRDLRKQVAEQEGVPVYAIFSNAQLAEMVERRAATPADLAKIDGVGKARIEKHGSLFLALLKPHPTTPLEGQP